MAVHDALSGGVRLFGVEHVFQFHLGHDIGMSLDRLMRNTLAFDHFTHLDKPWREAMKIDNCIARRQDATGLWFVECGFRLLRLTGMWV